MSQKDKIIQEKLGKVTTLFLYLTGESEGKPCYAYFAIKAEKFKEFKDKFYAGQADLEQYGEILASDYGTPTDEVKEFMEKTFAFKHDQAINLDVALRPKP